MADLVIPGVTAVDPALSHVAGRPLHLPGPSPTQGFWRGGAIMAAAAGGPAGLAALGGLAAMAAVEYLGGAHNGRSVSTPEAVGRLPAYVRGRRWNARLATPGRMRRDRTRAPGRRDSAGAASLQACRRPARLAGGGRAGAAPRADLPSTHRDRVDARTGLRSRRHHDRHEMAVGREGLVIANHPRSDQVLDPVGRHALLDHRARLRDRRHQEVGEGGDVRPGKWLRRRGGPEDDRGRPNPM